MRYLREGGKIYWILGFGIQSWFGYSSYQYDVGNRGYGRLRLYFFEENVGVQIVDQQIQFGFLLGFIFFLFRIRRMWDLVFFLWSGIIISVLLDEKIIFYFKCVWKKGSL